MDTLIEKFYKAFSELDAETMVALYHDDIIFEDPAFGVLHGERAKNMWRMLCATQKNKDFKVVYSNIKSDGSKGSATWEAFYNFSKTNRKVHNIVTATFQFQDGKIIKHTDHFNLRTWAKQAMGFKGFIMGGTAYFKSKLIHNTNNLLTKFEAHHH
ncbi:MAG: nuclear transport factor 2 family protein [Psychroserpens sp.]|uniref:nuclear transport factor 2 family protein n=1 Tax=Psychroserpens sp. TaxID=2020870 RepID=UPI003C740B75